MSSIMSSTRGVILQLFLHKLWRSVSLLVVFSHVSGLSVLISASSPLRPLPPPGPSLLFFSGSLAVFGSFLSLLLSVRSDGQSAAFFLFLNLDILQPLSLFTLLLVIIHVIIVLAQFLGL